MKSLLVLLLLSSFLIGPFTLAENTHSIDFESGSSQYLNITDGNQTGLDITGDISASFWIKRETLGVFQGIYSKRISSAGYYDLYISGGGSNNKLVFSYADGLGGVSVETSSVLLNSVVNWVNVVITADVSAKDVKFYFDGVLDSSSVATVGGGGATSIGDNTDDFKIGTQTTGVNYFDGLIDEMAIYNSVLTQTDVNSLYNSGNGYEHDGTETNLVSTWGFDNDLLDENTNSNDLTNNNSTIFSTDTPFVGEITATSSTSTLEFAFVPGDLDYIDDIGVIVGLTYHYETSTTTADWMEKHYFRWVGIYMILFGFIFFMIGNRILLELIIRWRK